MDLNQFDLFGEVKSEQERAIIFACQDVLKETGQTPSPSAYFGVLYKIVQQSVEQEKRQFFPQVDKLQKGDDLERCRGAVRLMGIVCQQLPIATIKKIYGETSKLMLSIFSKKPPTPLSRSGLDVILRLLTVPNIFEDQSANKLYNIVLEQAVAGKPKVRKRAVDIIDELFVIPDGRAEKLATITEKFSISIIRQCKQDNFLSSLYVIQILNRLVIKFPLPIAKNLAETVLRLPSLGQSMVTVCAMKFLGFIFDVTDISAVLCASLINALVDLKPNTVDSDPLMAYMRTIAKGYIVLSKLDLPLASKKLPSLIKEALMTFQGDVRNVNKTTAQALIDVFNASVTTPMIKEAVEAINSGGEQSKVVYIQIVNNLKPGLKYAYQNSWGHILEVIEKLFDITVERQPPEEGEATKKAMAILFSDFIKDIAYLHDGRWIQPVQVALAGALRLIGISYFLEILPIKFPSVDYPSSEKRTDDYLWLLLFLKKRLSHSHLSYFASKFIPITESLASNAQKATENGALVEAQLLSSIYLQLWELFPAFCNNPTDIPASFKTIARLLCTALVEKPNLRSIVAAGIQSLIVKNKTLLASNTSSGVPKENLDAISVFTKNFLPALFNLLVEEIPSHDHTYVYKTVEAFTSIADASLVDATFNNVAAKLIKETTVPAASSEGGSAPTTTSVAGNIQAGVVTRLTDIAAIFVPYLEMKNVEILFRIIRPQIVSENVHLQKKTFKVLVAICNFHRVLVGSNFSELVKILDETEPRPYNNATKKLRLKLMKIMLEESTTLDIETLKKLLPEVILNTKEVNAGSREVSNAILKFLGEQCVKLGNDSLKTLCNIISAGLALEPRFISATLFSLGFLLKNFHTSLPSDYKQELLQTSVLFLQSPNREIVHAALDFFQISIGITSKDVLKIVIPEFMKIASAWEAGINKKFHNNIKVILEKLFRKVGYEELSPHVPWTNLLQNIRKTLARAQKKKLNIKEEKQKIKKEDNYGKKEKGKKTPDKKMKKNEKEMDADSESDEFSSELFDLKPKTTDGTWVVEGKTDDDIIDFLESSASKHVVSSDPTKSHRKRKIIDSFEKADDGRIIVEDVEEEENKKKIKPSETQQQEGSDLAVPVPIVKPKPKPKSTKQLPKSKSKTSIHSATRYKSKKAGGDVLRKDTKYEPYAYLPLDPAQLNKRRRFNAHQQYKGVLTSTSKQGRAITKRRRK